MDLKSKNIHFIPHEDINNRLISLYFRLRFMGVAKLILKNKCILLNSSPIEMKFEEYYEKRERTSNVKFENLSCLENIDLTIL